MQSDVQLPQPPMLDGGNKVDVLYIVPAYWFMNASQQPEQEAQNRAEVDVAEITAETQADVLHEFVRIEEVSENTLSNLQMQILNQVNFVTDIFLQRAQMCVCVFIFEPCAELQYRDDINCQSKKKNKLKRTTVHMLSS